MFHRPWLTLSPVGCLTLPSTRFVQAQLPWRRSAIAFLGGVLRRCESLHPSVRHHPSPNPHREATVTLASAAAQASPTLQAGCHA